MIFRYSDNVCAFLCLKTFKVDLISTCSAEMLVNLGIPWVILGHSERRLILNESNEVSWFLKTIRCGLDTELR